MYLVDGLASQFQGLDCPYNYKIFWLVAAHHCTDDSGDVDRASPV